MSLFINARFLTQPVSGVQRYAREMVAALDRRLAADPDLRAELGGVVALFPQAMPTDLPDWLAIRPCGLPGGTGHAWEQGALWRATRGGVLLSLGNTGPLWHRRQVLALHDAHIYLVPEAYSRRYRTLHKAMRPTLARRAAALVTVSAHSAQTLGAALGLDPAAFHIVPNGARHILDVPADPGILARAKLSPGGFLLSVGNQSPNKNLARLIAAHRAAGPLAPPLVIAGAEAPGLARTGIDVSERVICLGRVSDAQLRALYEAAEAFVFPSLQEGFGIPPLEAMTLGCPVLAARRAALPEVLGHAPMWFDPLNVTDMARAISGFAQLSPPAREMMRRAGRAQAARFDWDASAEALLTPIRAALQGASEASDRPGVAHIPAQ